MPSCINSRNCRENMPLAVYVGEYECIIYIQIRLYFVVLKFTGIFIQQKLLINKSMRITTVECESTGASG